MNEQNYIDLSRVSSTDINNQQTKNVVDLPRVDNNNKDLKEFDGGNPAGNGGSPMLNHVVSQMAEKKKPDVDFWEFYVGLYPEFVLSMLESTFERLRDANNYQDANLVLGEIERIKKKYNIITPTKHL